MIIRKSTGTATSSRSGRWPFPVDQANEWRHQLRAEEIEAHGLAAVRRARGGGGAGRRRRAAVRHGEKQVLAEEFEEDVARDAEGLALAALERAHGRLALSAPHP